jgi:hypothetical protein
MYRLMLSLVFGVLLALSLGFKFHAGLDQSAALPADDGDIVALLDRNGFAVTRAPPNTDPQWVYGVRGDCSLQIADISLQGWHRSTLEWASGGRPLMYSVEGKLYAQQPILRPMVLHYLRRGERYMGMRAAPVRARAIIIDRGCPADPIAPAELEALS